MHLIHTAFYCKPHSSQLYECPLPQVSRFSSGNDFNMAKTFLWPIWKTGLNLWRKPKMATENEREWRRLGEGNNQRKKRILYNPLPGVLSFSPAWACFHFLIEVEWGGFGGWGGEAEAENQCLALYFCHSPWGFSSWLGFHCSTVVNKGPVWNSTAGGKWQQWPGGGLEPRQNRMSYPGVACRKGRRFAAVSGNACLIKVGQGIRCSHLHSRGQKNSNTSLL